MRHHLLTLASSAALLALHACSSGTSSAPHPTEPSGVTATLVQADVPRTPASDVAPTDLASAVIANNAFGLDLYAHVRAQSALASGNLLTSPISASLALTMTYAGARGQTATEMAGALHLGGSGDAIFAGQNALSQALNARAAAAHASDTHNATQSGQPAPLPDDYQLHLVNSVWGEGTYTWEAPFLQILASHYGTGVYQQDFKHAFEPARSTINDWVSSHTADKINDLLPIGSLDDSTRMVLVNALHLKLPWATVFSPNATAPGTFTRGDASTVSAMFMKQTSTYGYVDDGQAQVVALPLANRQLAVIIALPHADVSLADYEAGLTARSALLTPPETSSFVALSLPKTKFTSPTFSLADALKGMGMKRAFDGEVAEFEGICAHLPDGGKLYVSKVLQKTMIAMEETGVEAAAATAVVVSRTTSAPAEPPKPIAMVVDRPYLLSIVDVTSGALLMLGHIQDPTVTGGP